MLISFEIATTVTKFSGIAMGNEWVQTYTQTPLEIKTNLLKFFLYIGLGVPSVASLAQIEYRVYHVCIL